MFSYANCFCGAKFFQFPKFISRRNPNSFLFWRVRPSQTGVLLWQNILITHEICIWHSISACLYGSFIFDFLMCFFFVSECCSLQHKWKIHTKFDLIAVYSMNDFVLLLVRKTLWRANKHFVQAKNHCSGKNDAKCLFTFVCYVESTASARAYEEKPKQKIHCCENVWFESYDQNKKERNKHAKIVGNNK